jgi:hypothetical protein
MYGFGHVLHVSWYIPLCFKILRSVVFLACSSLKYCIGAVEC